MYLCIQSGDFLATLPTSCNDHELGIEWNSWGEFDAVFCADCQGYYWASEFRTQNDAPSFTSIDEILNWAYRSSIG